MNSKLSEKLKAKFGNAPSRIGGKGSARRKKKAVRKNANSGDKRLQTQLKKLNVSLIPAIEEVNLFQEDGTVIHFKNPRVQASIAANTYVVSGSADTKEVKDLLPGILPQLGPQALEQLQNIQEHLPQNSQVDDDDDDEIPDLVDNVNFEQISKQDDEPEEDKVDEGEKVEPETKKEINLDEMEQVS